MKKAEVKISKSVFDKQLSRFALLLAAHGVRNTDVENYHAGKYPSSKTGDYSDVKVVSPYGEILWTEVSKISDEEMKEFNIEVVNKLYTLLQFFLNPYYKKEKDILTSSEFILSVPDKWNKPVFDEGFLESIKIIKGEKSDMEYRVTKK